ncbi:MAG: AAA family ATPase [Chlamydiota bacterium]
MRELENIPGNAHIKEKLKSLLQQKELPSPLLFVGPRGVGKEIFARAFGQALLAKKQSTAAIRINLRQFEPTGKAIGYPIEQIKEAIKVILAPPFEADRKVIMISQAELMSPVSANALLKTLEEPPAHSTILLTSSKKKALLPTLVSRCFELSFYPIADEELCAYLEQEHGKSAAEARRISFLAHGELTRASALAADGEQAFFDLIAAIGCALIAKDSLALQPLLLELDKLVATEPVAHRMERREEACFALFYWYRDLELLQIKQEKAELFFYDHRKQLSQCLSLPRPSLDEVGEKMEKIYQALQLHIKLSHALDILSYF